MTKELSLLNGVEKGSPTNGIGKTGQRQAKYEIGFIATPYTKVNSWVYYKPKIRG